MAVCSAAPILKDIMEQWFSTLSFPSNKWGSWKWDSGLPNLFKTGQFPLVTGILHMPSFEELLHNLNNNNNNKIENHRDIC